MPKFLIYFSEKLAYKDIILIYWNVYLVSKQKYIYSDLWKASNRY